MLSDYVESKEQKQIRTRMELIQEHTQLVPNDLARIIEGYISYKTPEKRLEEAKRNREEFNRSHLSLQRELERNNMNTFLGLTRRGSEDATPASLLFAGIVQLTVTIYVLAYVECDSVAVAISLLLFSLLVIFFSLGGLLFNCDRHNRNITRINSVFNSFQTEGNQLAHEIALELLDNEIDVLQEQIKDSNENEVARNSTEPTDPSNTTEEANGTTGDIDYVAPLDLNTDNTPEPEEGIHNYSLRM